jgi:hypothetical protein
MPLVNLAADVSSSGGSLRGARSYYYAVSGVNAEGAESPLSFIVRAHVPSEADTNQIMLRDLSFGAGTETFHVYRGTNPAQLFRIAENEPVADRFADDGRNATAATPPDRNYHHANFYWRLELVPPNASTIHSAASIGNEALGMTENEYRGKVVRITAGTGKGQERVVSENNDVQLTLTKPWEVEPDETSEFVVAESGWNFGAMTESSPVTFTVPNRQKASIHIIGRSANINDRECAPELSPLTRHTIGATADSYVPEAPKFGLESAGRGNVALVGISFDDLQNTHSITAGSLTLHFWDELQGISTVELATAVDASAETITITNPAAAKDGVLLQAGKEILVAHSIHEDGVTYEVQRGAYGSTAADHEAGVPVFHLDRRVSVMPFVKGFFGSPASGSYGHLVTLPNARIAAAEFFVTNSLGNSRVTGINYAHREGGGIRTLSGGQITLQVEGTLAIQSDAVPPLATDTKRAVRDVFGTLSSPPVGGSVEVRVKAGGEKYCDLTFADGRSASTVFDGAGQPPLDPRAPLGLEILSIPRGENTSSGAGLTVTVRF